MTRNDPLDPKGLMKDAFAIDGITIAECRSIFLDWVLGVPSGRDVRTEVKMLLAQYGDQAGAGHPMVQTLNAALEQADVKPRRRGGRSSRISRQDDTP